MNRVTNSMPRGQKGAVLAVALMLLLVMTIVAISAMDGSTLGFKMSANSVYHEEAFNNSESGREVVGDMLVQYNAFDDWSQVDAPAEVLDRNGVQMTSSTLDTDFKVSNGAGENTWDTSSLDTDIIYRDTVNDIEAEIAVVRSVVSQNVEGAGTAQYQGYRGIGKGLAGQGGAHIYFEFRSEGIGQANAEAVTSADFRYVP